MELVFFFLPGVAVFFTGLGVGVIVVTGVRAGVPTVGVKGTVGAFALGAVNVETIRMAARMRMVSPTTAAVARR